MHNRFQNGSRHGHCDGPGSVFELIKVLGLSPTQGNLFNVLMLTRKEIVKCQRKHSEKTGTKDLHYDNVEYKSLDNCDHCRRWYEIR